jgi:hypothetical protein
MTEQRSHLQNNEKEFTEISIGGKFRRVRAMSFDDLTIIILGGWIKTATVKDEMWLPGNVINDPESVIAKLRKERTGADIFSFTQKLPNIQPKYRYRKEWYNVAAIPISSYADWWENRLSQVTRKNVRRAARRGIIVRRVDFSDNLIEGIVKINNETPIRQGRRFWHYGKSFEAVKKDYSDFLDRSDILGAYYDDELVGFTRIVYMGETASILQLLCLNRYYDKRPANALIARAVELCAEKELTYLVYGQYIYDKVPGPLTEFKRRNGFEQFLLPSYFIPLTIKGQIAMKCNVHLGMKRLLPKGLLRSARALRANFLTRDNMGKKPLDGDS